MLLNICNSFLKSIISSLGLNLTFIDLNLFNITFLVSYVFFS